MQVPHFQRVPATSVCGGACWRAPGCVGAAEPPAALPTVRTLGRSAPQASHAKKPDWLRSVHAAHSQPSTQTSRGWGDFLMRLWGHDGRAEGSGS